MQATQQSSDRAPIKVVESAVAILVGVVTVGLIIAGKIDNAASETTSIKDSVTATNVKMDEYHRYEVDVHSRQQKQLDDHSVKLDEHTNRIQEGTAATMRVGAKLDIIIDRMGRPVQQPYSPSGYRSGDPILPSRHY